MAIRITVWSPNRTEVIDIFEMYDTDHSQRTWKQLYSMARSYRNRLGGDLEIEDTSRPWVQQTERQNRIADAKVCLEQIRIQKSRLRAALSGNYDNVL